MTCDCGATPFGRHDRACYEVTLRKRPRVDCEHCGEDGQPAASKGSWFADNDWCARCEDNYEPSDDAEAFRGGEAAAYERECMSRYQELK